MKKLPLGEQNFEKIREKDLLYVDKTQQIFDMINYGDYLFLSRPRRFGKSLLVSTLAALFEGKKEWFEGLWIEDKIEWETYPVIRIDFARITHSRSLEVYEASLVRVLKAVALKYDLDIQAPASPDYLDELLTGLYRKTGKRAVILIDEYDKPVTDHLVEIEKAERNRKWLREFYTTIKADSGYVHFFFITGISKFAKMSVFSALNNLRDLSLMPKFNDLVGFTEEEIIQYFPEHITAFAKEEGMSREDLLNEIRYWYDGYSWDSEGRIFNPFAMVNVFADLTFNPYWFESGTPNFLIRLIKHKYALEQDKPPVIEDFEEVYATKETFDSYDLKNINLTALLFQTGYLTIKTQEKIGRDILYTLGFPNYEVRWSMASHLLEAFTGLNIGLTIQPKALRLQKALMEADSEQFLLILRSLFAGIPSPILKSATEYHYQAMFNLVLTLLGIENVILEKAGYIGRADGVLSIAGKVYVIEFKFARKGTMKTLLKSALQQIEEKGYHHPYLGSGEAVYKVAAGFLFKAPAKGKKPVLTIDVLWEEV